MLLEKEAINEEELYKLKSEILKIPYRDLKDYRARPEILKFVPLEAAQHYRFIPISIDTSKGVLEVGMLNPEDIGAREALKFIAHRNNLTPQIYLISLTDFRDILKQYSTLKGEVKEALEE